MNLKKKKKWTDAKALEGGRESRGRARGGGELLRVVCDYLDIGPFFFPC